MSSLRDNQLKIEISNLKNMWVSSGYKARFVVVLISEDDIYLEDVEDRLSSIRRAANLDPRSTFVLPPDLSDADLKDFVTTLLSSLQPSVVEYYRDLSKHARRKRNRGSVPPPTVPPTIGTSQTLSLHGWNVRYEFKLGVFAEFRQEMDAAFRNYESAYEILFGQEVFESIAGWNPRFNDARLLADSLAIRILRCSLWSGQTTNAVRRWVIHRDRTQDIVNRRGKGTKNYGWAAWEARWSMVMAQLIQRAEIPSFSADVLQNPSRLHESIFAPPEKNLPVHDIALPWELLHHEGYWLDRSAKYSILRRTLAHKIPADDRIAPSQTPASKSYMCDTYLVPVPYSEAPDSDHATVNHSGLILDTLKASLEQFSKRQQIRKVERLSLQIAKEYVRVGSWSEALNMLKPLWPQLTWRSAGWWELMEEFAWTLRECALRLQDNETVIRTDWELLSHGEISLYLFSSRTAILRCGANELLSFFSSTRLEIRSTSKPSESPRK
jgi:trafficking protein particle complex subunit 11